MHSFLMSTSNQQDINTLDNKVTNFNYIIINILYQIHETVDQINSIKLQREFYLGFAQSPKVIKSFNVVLLFVYFIEIY